jgi:hypothetical protein
MSEHLSQGRRIFDDIRKFIKFIKDTMSSNSGRIRDDAAPAASATAKHWLDQRPSHFL